MRIFVFTTQPQLLLLRRRMARDKKWWKIKNWTFSFASKSFSVTFFRSRIEPRPNTDILHIVSSCSRFKELPFGPNSFPTKLNCKSQFRNNNNLVLFFVGFVCTQASAISTLAFNTCLRMVLNGHCYTYRNLYRFVTRYVYHFAFLIGHVRHWRWWTFKTTTAKKKAEKGLVLNKVTIFTFAFLYNLGRT